MARPLRIEFEGGVYHIAARGNERRKVFFSQRDYERFLEYVDEARSKFGIILHAYVLMGNHYHLVIETPTGHLSRAMHHINSAYTTYVNTKKKRSGHLFQGRYKSLVVDRDAYLLELSRYLHLNPVRARMVERPEDYGYSSYRAYIGTRSEPRVTTATVLGLIGAEAGREQAGYRAFVDDALGSELESPLRQVYGGAILGGEEFIATVLGKHDVLRRDSSETSYRKSMCAALPPGGLLALVRRHYGLSEEEALSKDARWLSLTLLKRYSGARNAEIGALLGGMSAAAVAKGYQRCVRRLEQDREFLSAFEAIEQEMSRVKG